MHGGAIGILQLDTDLKIGGKILALPALHAAGLAGGIHLDVRSTLHCGHILEDIRIVKRKMDFDLHGVPCAGLTYLRRNR